MSTARRSTPADQLLQMRPGTEPVVTCYLKLEPRDLVRKKYLTKARNRARALLYALHSLGWDKRHEEVIRADVERVLRFLDDPGHLPHAQGVAIFVSSPRKLFEVRPLPLVHRSRLVVDRTPLIRELAASEAEFGRIFTVTLDRTSAVIWEVTAYAARVVQKVVSPVTRGMRYHAAGARGDATGEHAFHNRIRDERRRHLESVARTLFELDRRSPGHQIALLSAGIEAAAMEPFLHSYLADRLIGVGRLAPRDATASAVQQITMELRAAHARSLEARHIDELREGLGTGWAVNGVRQTLAALAQGQVRLLLVHGDAVMPGFRSLRTGRLATQVRDLREDGEVVTTLDIIDDAIEEALRQHVALDVAYEPRYAGAIDGLAALLRFK